MGKAEEHAHVAELLQNSWVLIKAASDSWGYHEAEKGSIS